MYTFTSLKALKKYERRRGVVITRYEIKGNAKKHYKERRYE